VEVGLGSAVVASPDVPELGGTACSADPSPEEDSRDDGAALSPRRTGALVARRSFFAHPLPLK
jgi:hypothetical protein